MGPTPHLSQRALRWLIRGIDFLARQITGIVDFDSSEDGLVRIELGRVKREVPLADGTRLHPGDAVVVLHFWNERLLLTPSWGPGLRWATVTRRRTVRSLRRLARYMRDDRCNEIKALRIEPALTGGRRASVLTRIVAKHGFEAGPDADAAVGGSWLYRFFDNLWLWLLAWTFNPVTLKGWRFDRRRREFWMSRERFIALYGGDPAGDETDDTSSHR